MNGAGMSMSSSSASFFSMDGSGGAMSGGGVLTSSSRKRPHDSSDLIQIARKTMRLDKEALDARLMQVFVRQSDLNIFELTTLKKRGSALTQFLTNHSLRDPDEVIAAIQAEIPQHHGKVVAGPTSTGTAVKSHGSTASLSLPEIKLAGAGGIPVAISTTLPPAVARLSQQQGGTPLDPGRSPEKLPVGGSLHIRAASGVRPGVGGRLDPADQIAEKAKQEAYVLQRVAGLQREGLWFEKRLPKVYEPSRNKAHWDYLLEEMTWLATDFAQERKWKKAMARKVARSIQKHFQEKKQEKLKAEKATEMHARKLASFMARGVKQFWNNVGKMVEFKQNTLIEEKRKQALDQHLSFIVGETEKFSSLVAESMNKPANSSQTTPPPSTSLSDGEFEPEGNSSDDEETIEREEEHVMSNEQEKEIELLQKESELSLDDILDQLPDGYLEQRAKEIESEEGGSRQEGEGDSSDFSAEGSSDDDEATLEEQEAAEARDRTKLDARSEVKELEADNELSIEELKAKYGATARGASGSGGLDTPPQDEADVEMESEDEDDDEDDDLTGSEDDESSLLESLTSHKEDTPLSSLLKPPLGSKTSEDGEADQKMNDVAALAESIQPKGYTLESTSVVTPVPFLLQFPLREYQHVGLDWLVTMYDRALNGILADEMGLGKTIQTISLLAHLACEKGIWGPHLIVVPTSVLLNWEMELKKWAPGFKVLTYYGSIKERRAKRTGWTKPNSFHVCVTSYKLAVQDHQSFRRKQWCYLILDEAQNIKNFKSQRWQLLLNFNTERRLLLTGTPLQNNLNELWSLMHFLMPALFQSHSEFQAWFSHPMKDMVEGNAEYNENIVKRLHKVLRPFLLRRLKSQVEKQLPKKYEHVVMCRLSNRQKYLYDDFMSRTKTKETLANGTMLSVINILMQLRKVCNHPNLFEERATLSPFHMNTLQYQIPSLVFNALNYDVFKDVNLESMNLNLLYNELTLSLGQGFSMRRLRPAPHAIEELAMAVEAVPPPPLPRGKPKLRVRCKDPKASVRVVIVNTSATNNNNKVVKTHAINIGNILVRQIICQGGIQGLNVKPALPLSTPVSASTSLTPTGTPMQVMPVQLVQRDGSRSTIKFLSAPRVLVQKSPSGQVTSLIKLPAVISQASTTNTSNKAGVVASGFVTQGGVGQTITTPSGTVLRVTGSAGNLVPLGSRTPTVTTPATPSSLPSALVSVTSSNSSSINSSPAQAVSPAVVGRRRKTDSQVSAASNLVTVESDRTSPTSMFIKSSLEEKRRERRTAQLALVSRVNNHRLTTPCILYGEELRNLLRINKSLPELEDLVCPGYEHRVQQLTDVFNNFLLYVPTATAPPPSLRIHHPHPSSLQSLTRLDYALATQLRPKLRLLHPVTSTMCTQFPDPRLIQYDCGKLQSLDVILRKLKAGGHRVLIFTQMTRMLDVLEAFLNFHGHIYLRLDGTTKVDQRQVLMERFNIDPRIFCFILSTRSGGVGVNLTGADTVVFYDSDWNPTMDAQAQDRCHRIGQTRDVHIYRLISEKTIEENILRKANQKRLLGDMAIEGGNFTTAFFKSSTIHDLFDTEQSGAGVSADEREDAAVENNPPVDKSSLASLENALAAAEDATDVAAARIARAEAQADAAEFDETIPLTEVVQTESKAEQEVEALMEQLSGVERWAVTFYEAKIAAAGSGEALEASLEAQKREWELERVAAAKRDEERRAKERLEARCELLTYASEDAANQVGKKNRRRGREDNARSKLGLKEEIRLRRGDGLGSKEEKSPRKGARSSTRKSENSSPGKLEGRNVETSRKSLVLSVEKTREKRLKERQERLKSRRERRVKVNGRLKRDTMESEEEMTGQSNDEDFVNENNKSDSDYEDENDSNSEEDNISEESLDDSSRKRGRGRPRKVSGRLSKTNEGEKKPRKQLRGTKSRREEEDESEEETRGRRSQRLTRGRELTQQEATPRKSTELMNGEEEIEWQLDGEKLGLEEEELGQSSRGRKGEYWKKASEAEGLGSKKRTSDRLKQTNGVDARVSLAERISARRQKLEQRRKARTAARDKGLDENCSNDATEEKSENTTEKYTRSTESMKCIRSREESPPVRKYTMRKRKRTKENGEEDSGSEKEERGELSVIKTEVKLGKNEIRIVNKSKNSGLKDDSKSTVDERVEDSKEGSSCVGKNVTSESDYIVKEMCGNEPSTVSKGRIRLVRNYSLGKKNLALNFGSAFSTKSNRTLGGEQKKGGRAKGKILIKGFKTETSERLTNCAQLNSNEHSESSVEKLGSFSDLSNFRVMNADEESIEVVGDTLDEEEDDGVEVIELDEMDVEEDEAVECR